MESFPHICEDFSSLNVRNPSAEIVLKFSSQFSPTFSSHFHVRKAANFQRPCEEFLEHNVRKKSVEISSHFSSHFPALYFPHNFPYIYFPHIFLTFSLTFGM